MLAFTWSEFAQQVASGIREGAIYGALALAVVIIYRSTRVINFAQGEMATFTTFIGWALMSQWAHLSFWEAFPIVLAIAFVGGVGIERAVIRWVEGAPVLTIVIVTLGLALLLDGLINVIWGGATRQLKAPFSTRTIDVAGAPISLEDIGIVVVLVVLVLLLGAFFRFTKLGLGLRAASLNPESSRLVGVRVSWMLAFGWGISSVLGAVAGLLTAPLLSSFDPTLMQPILLYAFSAAVLGGLDSPVGAVVGGILLGLTITLLGRYLGYVGSTLQLPVALALILCVLLVRPAGLFGRVVTRRV